MAPSCAPKDRTQSLLDMSSFSTTRIESCTGWLLTLAASTSLPRCPMEGIWLAMSFCALRRLPSACVTVSSAARLSRSCSFLQISSTYLFCEGKGEIEEKLSEMQKRRGRRRRGGQKIKRRKQQGAKREGNVESTQKRWRQSTQIERQGQQ